MSQIEYDEQKRQQTLVKHGIDFLDAAYIFGSDYLRLRGISEAEERFIAVGAVQMITIAVVFTMRGETIRIITARRARRNEREAYEKYLAERGSAS